MESYDIQHDFLFSTNEMANDSPAFFNEPRNAAELKRAIPVKASVLLRSNGEAMISAFRLSGKPILLIDDLPKTDNPIVKAYSAMLIKGMSSKFRAMGSRVFKG